MKVKTVLIADDDIDDIELLTEGIANYSKNIEISYVQNGLELLDKLNNFCIPDILILDLNMPCRDGKSCLVEIRADERLDHMIVIVFSNETRLTEREECLSLGANYFVGKPFNINELMKFAESVSNGTFDFA